ncbi:hypothetical protein Xen7305DRAFT_00011070 [Xenococcus sp. PCC 7305]|uniref:hypothetical protein n=1 Tax=Xenococcus sp. PCC 7305 TaxID=102125 RepID=UPI0002ABA06D|nr:hypothetical protein [Xenococcus sp. PCC 7305]ELS01403.1 hypothetical protein Xen7305DRAFT_00011070 [Xenococcus sp. PCC 7305]
MDGYYCNFAYCINSSDTIAIANAISKLLRQEQGITQIPQLPYLIFNFQELRQIRFWERPPLAIVGIGSGNNGWSIIKSYPNEWLILRALNNNRLRLWNLATELKSDAFFYRVIDDIDGFLLEISRGRIHYNFYSEPKFSLIKVPESFRRAIKVNPEFARRISELYKDLDQQEKDGEEYFSVLTKIVIEEREGDAERSNRALGKLIDPSQYFWGCCDFFSRVYIDFDLLNSMDIKLLYFQLPDNYSEYIRLFIKNRQEYFDNESF